MGFRVPERGNEKGGKSVEGNAAGRWGSVTLSDSPTCEISESQHHRAPCC